VGKPAGPGRGGPAQRPRVKAARNLSRKAQNLKGKMIAQYARRESNLKPEAKDGSPRYLSRQSSFQVHGGSPTGQNNSSYRIPKYPICTPAEAGRLFRKYKGGEETQTQLSIVQHFGQFAAQFVLFFASCACLLAFSIAQWFGIACCHVIRKKFRSSCCRSKNITILECAFAFCFILALIFIRSLAC